jgi:hypothetical protein
MHVLNLFGNRIRRFLPPVTRFWQMPPRPALWFAFGFSAAFLLRCVWALVEASFQPGLYVRMLP